MSSFLHSPEASYNSAVTGHSNSSWQSTQRMPAERLMLQPADRSTGQKLREAGVREQQSTSPAAVTRLLARPRNNCEGEDNITDATNQRNRLSRMMNHLACWHPLCPAKLSKWAFTRRMSSISVLLAVVVLHAKTPQNQREQIAM